MFSLLVFASAAGVTVPELTKSLKDIRSQVVFGFMACVLIPIIGGLVSVIFFVSPQHGGGMCFMQLMPTQAMCLFLIWVCRGSMPLGLVLLVLSNFLTASTLWISIEASWDYSFGSYVYPDMENTWKMPLLTGLCYTVAAAAGIAFRQWLSSIAMSFYSVGMRLCYLVLLLSPINHIMIIKEGLLATLSTVAVFVTFSYVISFLFVYFASYAIHSSIRNSRSIVFSVMLVNGAMASIFYVESNMDAEGFLDVLKWWFTLQFYLGFVIAHWLRWFGKGVEAV